MTAQLKPQKKISLRRWVQGCFFMITLFLGIKFYLFAAQLGSGAGTFVPMALSWG